MLRELFPQSSISLSAPPNFLLLRTHQRQTYSLRWHHHWCWGVKTRCTHSSVQDVSRLRCNKRQHRRTTSSLYLKANKSMYKTSSYQRSTPSYESFKPKSPHYRFPGFKIALQLSCGRPAYRYEALASIHSMEITFLWSCGLFAYCVCLSMLISYCFKSPTIKSMTMNWVGYIRQQRIITNIKFPSSWSPFLRLSAIEDLIKSNLRYRIIKLFCESNLFENEIFQ